MRLQAVFALTALLVLSLLSATLRGEDKPAGQRMLEGAEARKAAELQREIYALMLAAKWADAVTPAEALLELREQKQGTDHWQAVDARLLRDLARQMAKEPEAVQKELAESRKQEIEALELAARGQFQEAATIFAGALSLGRKILGDSHVEIGTYLNNLGLVQRNLGNSRRRRRASARHWRSGSRPCPPVTPPSPGVTTTSGWSSSTCAK
jgi:hypothetical protein